MKKPTFTTSWDRLHTFTSGGRARSKFNAISPIFDFHNPATMRAARLCATRVDLPNYRAFMGFIQAIAVDTSLPEGRLRIFTSFVARSETDRNSGRLVRYGQAEDTRGARPVGRWLAGGERPSFQGREPPMAMDRNPSRYDELMHLTCVQIRTWKLFPDCSHVQGSGPERSRESCQDFACAGLRVVLRSVAVVRSRRNTIIFGLIRSNAYATSMNGKAGTNLIIRMTPR